MLSLRGLLFGKAEPSSLGGLKVFLGTHIYTFLFGVIQRFALEVLQRGRVYVLAVQLHLTHRKQHTPPQPTKMHLSKQLSTKVLYILS